MIPFVAGRRLESQNAVARLLVPKIDIRGWIAATGLTVQASAFIGAVAFGGAVLFLVACTRLMSDHMVGLAAMLVLAVAAERISVPLPKGGEFVPSTLVYTTGVLVLPLPAAVVMAFVGTLGGEIMARKPWYRAAFNTGQVTLACTAAALTWAAIGGAAAVDVNAYLAVLPGALLAMATYYTLNTALVSIVLSLVGGGSPWQLWWANHRGVLIPQIGMQTVGILMAGAWRLDLRAMVLLTLPAGITWLSYRQVRVLETKAEIEQELRARSEHLAARWEALAEAGERLSTTVDPKALLETVVNVVVDHCADAACVIVPGTGVASAAKPDAPTQLRARLAATAATVDGYVAAGVMALPLTIGDRDLGTLYAAWSSGGPSPDQAALLDHVVGRIAVALQNAVLSSEAAEVQALREVDRLKSDLLASVSHELTNPIALVMGYGELLEKRPPEQEQARWMGGKILAAGEHLKRMVEDLLDAGRLESGRFALDRQRVDLRSVAEASLESARAAHPGPRFIAAVPGLPVIVEGDRTRLLQVLTNLLQNAARYGPPNGEVRLVVEVNGTLASVAVEDQGPGVAPGERQRIFEKFYRTGAAERKAKKGLGLGLTIAHDLVAAHGGEIRVEDGPSGGARFVVELPRFEVAA